MSHEEPWKLLKTEDTTVQEGWAKNGGVERESTEVELWGELGKIERPVLVIGGGRTDALLKPAHVEKYRKYLPSAAIVVFEDSCHNVSEPNYERFINKVRTFLERIDRLTLSS